MSAPTESFDAATPYEPIAVERRYPPPRGRIHPDPSLGWLRRLFPVVLAHRWVFFGSLALALVSMLLNVSIPAIIRAAVDNALTERTASLWGFVVLLGVVGVTRAVLTFLFRYGLFRTAFAIDTDLRILLYDHLNSLSFSFYDRVQSGQVISRANSDIRSVQMFLVFGPILGMTLIMFTVAVGYMLSIHVVLTLVAVLPLPVVFLLGQRLRDEVFPLSWIVQSRSAEVATLVDENLNGVRVVRSFAAERQQIDDLARAATRLRWAGERTIWARANHNPFIENLPRVGILLVLLYGGRLVVQGEITEGTLFAFAAYIVLLQAPFRTLGLFLIFSQRARASAGRIYEVLDEQPEIVDRPDAAHLPEPVRGAVTFDAVTFAYRRPAQVDPEVEVEVEVDPGDAGDGDGPGSALVADGRPEGGDDEERISVLRGLTLTVEAGETVAVVGRTGSGKSTLGRLLARFYDVDAGAVRVDGHDVRDVTQVSLRHAVGIVSDEPFLFSASLADNIAYARPDADRADVVDAARAAQAHGFITALPDGYDEVVGERGYTLSGGQRQRVALARALLANPRILVLDDATSAIDVQVEERIHHALRERMVDRTTIIIAHRLSTIALADRVVLIEDGRVAASGTHRELLATDPRYAEILANLDGDDAPPAAGAGDADPTRPAAPGSGNGVGPGSPGSSAVPDTSTVPGGGGGGGA